METVKQPENTLQSFEQWIKIQELTLQFWWLQKRSMKHSSQHNKEQGSTLVRIVWAAK